jgi:glycosyltransferase involved in cell wall biosynthesis
MRIIYIHQYFRTPEEGGAIRSWHLANALATEGHDVMVITSHNALSEIRQLGNIKVCYIQVSYDNSFGIRKRIQAFLSFFYKAFKFILSEKKPDLLFATSTPLTVGVLALLLKKVKGIPYYFEVRDLWPLVPEEMGIISNPLLLKTAYSFEKSIYQNARRIIALSPSMEAYISERIKEKEKLLCIPNFADCEFFTTEKNLPSERYPQLIDKFVIGYFGAAGKANDLLQLAKAAHYLKASGITKVVFWIMASGSELKRLKNFAQQHELDSMVFSDYLDKESIRKALTYCDASYVSYADYPSLWTGSPNKFFDSIAAGKLVILNFGGWLKEVVEDYHCGFYYDRRRPEQFWQKLEPFLSNAELLQKAQANSRRLALQKFSRTEQVSTFLNLFRPGTSFRN